MKTPHRDSGSSPPNPSVSGFPPPPPIPDHELLRRIGAGAYGQVWLARNATGAYRAVKIVHRRHFDHDGPFQRELTGIRHYEPVSRGHPGHVDILHVGADPNGEWFYHIMEAADDRESGDRIDPARYTPKTLQSEIQVRSRLPARETVALALVLADALAHLHGHGLIHRDIKPSNIIYVQGEPRLADIGLVSRFDSTVSRVGTDGFMAPEGPGSPRADLFSLGKVLYEASTGLDRTRFPELPTNTGAAGDAESRALLELNQVILRACEFDPARRYGSAAAMAADLRLLRDGESLTRLRGLERALRRTKRISAVALVLVTVGLAAYAHQLRHNRVVTAMAEDNRRLAEQRRDDLIAARVEAGFRELESGDRHHALVSLARALEAADGDPARERPQRVRLKGFFDQHPKLTAVVAHDDRVRQCNFSPDGTRLVTASNDGTARVWDAATGEPLAPPMVHGGEVARAGFDPSGTRILTRSGDGTAALWEAETAKRLATFTHGEGVAKAVLNADGSKVLVAGGETARVWFASGEPVSPLMRTGAAPRDAGFGPGGRFVWTAGRDGRVRFWNPASGEELSNPINHGAALLRAALSPDARLAATAGADGFVAVWQRDAGDEPVFRLPHSTEEVAVDFSPCGLMLITSDRPAKKLRVWSVEDGSLLREFEGNLSLRPRVSPDGAHVAFSSFGNEARIVNLQTGETIAPPLAGGWFDWAPFSPDGRRIAVPSTFAGIVRVWDLAAEAEDLVELRAHGPLAVLTYNRDGSLLAAGGDEIRVWNTDTWEPAVPPMVPETGIGLIDFSPDGGRLLAASGPCFLNTTGRAWLHTHEVSVWDTATGEAVFPPLAPGGCIRHAAFSPDGRLIATAGSRRVIRFWDGRSGEPLPLSLQHDRDVIHFAFSPDGRHLASASGRGVFAWDVETGELLYPPIAHSHWADQVAFSPDGNWLITSSYFNQTLHTWDARTGEAVGESRQPLAISAFALSHDGRRLMTAGTGCAKLVSLPFLDNPSDPRCHDEGITVAALHPASPFFLTQGREWTRVWDAERGGALLPPLRRNGVPEIIRPTRGEIRPASAVFHPVRHEFAALAGKMTVHVRTLEPDPRPAGDLMDLALLTGAAPRPRNSPPPEDHIAGEWRRLRSLHPGGFSSTRHGARQWHRRLAEDLERSGQSDAALWHWQKLARVDFEYPGAFSAKARLLREREQWTEALEAAQTAVRLRGNPRDRHDLALTRLAAGDVDGYRETSRHLLEEFAESGNFAAFLLAAWTSVFDSANRDRAAEIADRLEQRASAGGHDRNPEISIVLGALRLRAGDHAGAANNLETGMQLAASRSSLANPAPPARAWPFLAMAEFGRGNQEEAVHHLASLETWLSETQNLHFDEQWELRLLQAEAWDILFADNSE